MMRNLGKTLLVLALVLAATVGVALLCLERPEIQLCYAQPIEYNIDGYATPDEWVTVFTV